MSSQLIELAEQCEKASGPNLRLDALIAHEVHGSTGHNVDFYTASVDAAMTLIPEGWFFSGFEQQRPSVRVWTEGNQARFSPQVDGPHPATPALALCAASLRARAESMK